MDKLILIEKTPFVFENTKTYYFAVFRRPNSNEYADLFVYKRVIKSFLGIKIPIFRKINEYSEIINISYSDKQFLVSMEKITYAIKKILTTSIAKTYIPSWDGYVGNISEEFKASMKRDGKLDELLKF